MTTDVRDYLFDLHGYLRIEQAVAPDDIDEMNRWADAHREYIDRPWEDGVEANRRGRWIGAVHTHTYNVENGVNFQSKNVWKNRWKNIYFCYMIFCISYLLYGGMKNKLTII